ncbi:MAG: undecaprenyl-diphosphatase [Parcubacteria bacterium C7867-005]|nr:MAG: undecaprenyl-diphosphatase [Parcubacteria bacterium C7867-005]
MSAFEAIVLGLVQGLTEFLPVSSSGHLIIVRDLMGINIPNALTVDAVFQLATILALIFYFFKDLVALPKNRTMFWAVVFGTLPAVFLGFLLEDSMETTFRNIHLVAWMFLLGSLIMYFAERFAKQDQILTPKRGLVIGFFQALALIPGISRSGATISGGLFSGLTREMATRFSFILSIPIILGSGLKKFFDLHKDGISGGVDPYLWIGSLVAFLTGLVAIHFLIRFLKNNKLTIFIWYRIVLALLILVFV